MAHLIDFFERGLRMSASAPCFAEPGGRVLDYGTVADLSHRIANGLHAAGVGPGDKVGLLSPNHLLTFVAVLGIVRSLGIWLPSMHATASRKTSMYSRAATAASCSCTAASRATWTRSGPPCRT